MESFSDKLFLITPARLALTGAKEQVSVGWKKMHAVVERLPWRRPWVVGQSPLLE